jgi:hypothetical protein
MARVCGFCERTGVTLEHVWADWVTTVLGQRRMRIELGRKSLRRTWNTQGPSDRINMTARVVCRRCNNNWMSDLENSAKPLLTQMMTSNKILLPLDTASRVLIAAWAIKTAMVIEHLSAERPTYYSQAERRWVKDTLIPVGRHACYRPFGDVRHWSTGAPCILVSARRRSVRSVPCQGWPMEELSS